MLLIVNLYRHPGLPTPTPVFDIIMGLTIQAIDANTFWSRDNALPVTDGSSSSNQVLVVGDFNCHHSYWHNPMDDSTGKRLARAIDTHGWIILNEEKSTLVTHPGTRDSIIDLALASPTLAASCLSSTSSDFWESDHFPVSTTIQGTSARRRKFKYKWKIGSDSLKEFSALCSADAKSLTDLPGAQASEKYDAFMDDLKHKLFHFIPPTARHPRTASSKCRASNPVWWNDKCREAIEERRRTTANQCCQ